MNRNQKLAIEMLDEIDLARSGGQSLEDLEQKLWRLLDSADDAFPAVLAGRVEDLVLELRRLREENLASGSARDVDEFRGAEVIYNEVNGALNRFLT